MIGNVIQPNGAVSGGGEVYSTSAEVAIGTWDGQTLYRRVFTETIRNMIYNPDTPTFLWWNVSDVMPVSGHYTVRRIDVYERSSTSSKNIALYNRGIKVDDKLYNLYVNNWIETPQNNFITLSDGGLRRDGKTTIDNYQIIAIVEYTKS